MAALVAFVDEPVPEQILCDQGTAERAIKGMMSVLPRQSKDGAAGPLMVETYVRKLTRQPRGAVEFLWSRSVDTLRWFPTVAECLEIIAQWSPPATDLARVKSIADSRIRRERELRFADICAAVVRGEMTVDAVSALPDQVKRILDARNLIRMGRDGEVRLLTFDGDEQVMLAKRWGAAA